MSASGFVEDPVAHLEKVSAMGRDLLVGESTIVVRPLRFMELIRATKAIKPIIEHVANLEKANGEDAEVSILELLEVAPEAMVQIAGMCTGKDRAWFDTLDSEQGLDVFAMVFMVNRDFFVERLLPKLMSLKSQVFGGTRKLETAGPTASTI
jgi:hypothetical protein